MLPTRSHCADATLWIHGCCHSSCFPLQDHAGALQLLVPPDLRACAAYSGQARPSRLRGSGQGTVRSQGKGQGRWQRSSEAVFPAAIEKASGQMPASGTAPHPPALTQQQDQGPEHAPEEPAELRLVIRADDLFRQEHQVVTKVCGVV